MFVMGTLLTQLNMPSQKYCTLENYVLSGVILTHGILQQSYVSAGKMRTLDLL